MGGEVPDLYQKDNDLFFVSRNNGIGAAQTVQDLVCNRLPKSYEFSPMTDIQVLCPGRKGELGVMDLNRRLQQTLNPPAADKTELKTNFYTFLRGDKVMHIKNTSYIG